MRRVLVAIVVVAACAGLAAVQVLASVALRARAVPGSWIALVPPAAGAWVASLGPDAPLPGILRLVLARNALAGGNLDLAARDVARLAPSRDKLALEASLAAAHGDVAGAVRDDLAAEDLAALEEQIAAVAHRGDIAGALALQHAAVDRLGRDPAGGEGLAEADFQLGLLEETQAYQFAPGAAERHAHELSARDAYAKALALAPLEERYLIAYGSQLLNLRDAPAADGIFRRAAAVDPTSAEPFVGMGEAALQIGRLAAARDDLERARGLNATSPAVQRLARKLDAR